MECEHVVKQFPGSGCGRFDPVEIPDVLASLFKYAPVVGAAVALVACDNRDGIERFYRVYGGNPLFPTVRVGLGKVQVHVVVHGITCDDKADVRDV
jgi:hypothetical protein